MRRKALKVTLAENLRWFMALPNCAYPNPNALATATKGAVSANTVRNILDPKRRTVTAKKGDGGPTLEKLEALAERLPDCQPWMLLHPDLQRALRAIEMDTKIEAEYAERKRGEAEPTKSQQGERSRETQRQRA